MTIYSLICESPIRFFYQLSKQDNAKELLCLGVQGCTFPGIPTISFNAAITAKPALSRQRTTRIILNSGKRTSSDRAVLPLLVV